MTPRKGCMISPKNSISKFFETPCVYESSYQFNVYRDEDERFTALQPKDCSVKPISAGCSHLRALFVPKKEIHSGNGEQKYIVSPKERIIAGQYNPTIKWRKD